MKIEDVFQYCPRCGKKIELKNRLFICPHCKLNHYLAPTPCNGAILLNKKDEILLVKRKSAPKKNYWDMPGGFIEYEESAEESVRRELKEELDLDLKEFTYFKSYPGTYLYKGVEIKTLGFIYLGRVTDEPMKAKDDIIEIRFFPLDAIPYDKLAFPPVKQGIKDFISSRQ